MTMHKDQSPTMLELAGMSLPAAFRLARAFCPRSDDEIAAEMGWGQSVANRIFHNLDYWPSLPNIPRLCRVLGNTIIIQWQFANVDICVDRIAPMDAPTMIRDVRRLMKEISDVLEECEKALEDNRVESHEARRVIRELEDLFRVGTVMLARLQAVIDEERGRSHAR